MAVKTWALPKGSKILVTGANGYIASHVVNELLRLGFRVIGTVRKEKPWLHDLFSKQGDFESVVVDNMKEGAFDEVVKDCSGIIHVAADASLNPDYEKVVPVTIGGTISILKLAAKTPSIKRVVLTSSSTACNLPKSFEPTVMITEDTWNEEAVALAKNLPDGIPDMFKGYMVYSASKTISEQEAWKFMKEQKPNFVLNTVLPSTNLGKNLDPANIGGSTGAFIRNMYTDKDFETYKLLTPQYHINVTDCALLHIAALLTPTIQNQRLFAYEKDYTQGDILRILKRMKPDFEWPAAPEMEVRDRSVVPGAKKGEDLVVDFFGRGYRSLEDSLRETFEDDF